MNATRYLEFKWTVSRGRDTYGYNICTLYVDGEKVARCNGGGYDMAGTCLGDFVARQYADRLLSLKPEEMPAQSHWEVAEKPSRRCDNTGTCTGKVRAGKFERWDDAPCPKCGGSTFAVQGEGKRIEDGRYFYGLSFHNPNYDPGEAVVGVDCTNRTLGGEGGKTVAEAEAAGESLGLERYQAFYSASSKVPTERHTVPLLDGGTGKSNVESIAKAIGLTFEYLPSASRRGRDSGRYIMHDDRS